MSSIESLKRSIIEKAIKEANDMIEKERKKLEEELNNYMNNLRKKFEQELNERINKLRESLEGKLMIEKIEMRKEITRVKNEIISQLFENAHSKLMEKLQRNAKDIIRKFISEAIEMLGRKEGLTIKISTQFKEVCNEIIHELGIKDCRIIEEKSNDFVLQIEDPTMSLVLDLSLKSKLELIKRKFLHDIANKLFIE